MNKFCLASSLFLLTTTALADTYIVDDGGGAGVDFTDLPAAVASVLDGDILIVRQGTYSGFSCQKGIAIRGKGSQVHVNGTATLQGILPAEKLGMVGISFTRLAVLNCDGLVSVTGVGESGPASIEVTITSSADVRLRNLVVHGWAGAPAMSVHDSAVEVVDSFIRGGTGADGYDYGEDGSDAASLTGSSRVQFASCSLAGGHGGWVSSEWSFDWGYGGSAVIVAASSELIISGSSTDIFSGGYNGSHDLFGGGGGRAPAILNTGAVRSSGVSFESYLSGSGHYESPGYDDPLLSAHRTPIGLRVAITGAVGGNARLFLGREVRQPSAPFLTKPLMVEPLRAFALGIIGSGGSTTLTIGSVFPTRTTDSFQLVLQGSVFAGGETIYTNSLVRLNR